MHNHDAYTDCTYTLHNAQSQQTYTDYRIAQAASFPTTAMPSPRGCTAALLGRCAHGEAQADEHHDVARGAPRSVGGRRLRNTAWLAGHVNCTCKPDAG